MEADELMEAIRSRDIDRACTLLVQRHSVDVWRFFHRFAPASADDLTQECFKRVFLGLPRLRRGKAVNGWVRAIRTSVLYDHWRKEGRRKKALTRMIEALWPWRSSADAITPEDEQRLWQEAMSEQRSDRLHEERRLAYSRHKAELKSVEREVLDGSERGMKFSEIAARVGKSEAAVKKIHQRALQKLERRVRESAS